MAQPAFHRACEAMPESYRAELIGGIVFEPSPAGYEHGRSDMRMACLLEHYAAMTRGLETCHNATVILGAKDEVQPDVLLRVMPEFGGQSHNTKKKKKSPRYITGAPELLAEVAHTSRAIDLHLKKDRYSLAGVLEYLVLCLEPPHVYWFDLSRNQRLNADADGIFKSRVFPGLWIDGDALLELDYVKSMAALSAGMQTSKYLEFASHLRDRYRSWNSLFPTNKRVV
jgi:hypothetical protein